MSVLLWASGGIDRLGRVLALAEAFGVRGLGTRIALPVEHAALGWLEAAGVRNPVLLPERDPELPHVLAACAGVDAVVVDVDRPLSRAEVRALSGRRPIVVVEGRGPGLAEAQLVVSLEGPRRPRWLADPSYAPLRRAVRLARDLRGMPRPVPVVVAHLGQRDDQQVATTVLQGIAAARDGGARLTGRVVADPRMAAWPALAGLARRLDLPPPIPALADASIAAFVEADVAVVGSGMAVYEAVACGVATIAVAGGRGVQTLAEGGAVVVPGGVVDEERIAAAVTALVASPAACAALATAGHALVDGCGADRVADRLIALLGTARTTDARQRHAI